MSGKNTFTVFIDGRAVEAADGMTIFEAAGTAHIEIPHLCHHPLLKPTGACRLCVVEVEGARALQASCTTPVRPDMKVWTQTERVVEARKAVIDLLLANHPLDCLTCERAGNCSLQDYAYMYGIKESRYHGQTKDYAPDTSNPFFERDHNKCIMCGRCIRICDEVVGANAIDYAYRGFTVKVATAYDEGLENSTCVFCGNCVGVCPVGALIPKAEKGAGRIWQTKQVRTVCTYCGVGCEVNLRVRDGKVVGVSAADGPANRGLLCVKGRFGYDFIHSVDRLTTPLIRRGGKNGNLEPAAWDEALSVVAESLSRIRRKYGPDALAGLASAKCTNEENYLMQRLVRAVFGTNNVDHCARLCHASSVAGLAMSFGSGAMTNSIPEIEDSDVIFIIGSNTAEAHPVIGTYVVRAQKKGRKVIVADPRGVGLAEKADLFLQHVPGTDVALLNGMMHVILKERLYDEGFVKERTEGFSELAEMLERYAPEDVEGITGVSADDIRAAARMYAKAERAGILYAMGITQHTTGTDNVMSVANLAMLTGNVGKRSAGVNPLRGQNNVQGACDMGGLPNVYTGYQAVTNDEARKKFEAAWGVASLPAKPGLTVVEVMDRAAHGDIKGLYIMGENPMVSDPDIGHVEEALRSVEFLVVQDIFLTETARFADVVLPGACFAEKDGTFTNTERRVQRIRKAVEPPGEARPDWMILCDVATRMGYPMQYESPADVMREIASLTPSYGGISYDRLEKGGLQWPCPTPDHPGTPFLHKDKFARGLGKFFPVEYRPPAEMPNGEYPFILTTGRMLYHYHTGTMTRRSRGLNAIRPEGYVEIHPRTAADLGIEDGDWVYVTSRRGRVRVKALLTERTSRRVVFMPFHFAETAANALTGRALDPVAKIPELKVSAVRVERAPDDEQTGPGVWYGDAGELQEAFEARRCCGR